MTSSNKVRRYLQHQKQHSMESENTSQSSSQLFVDTSSSPTTPIRKFRGKTQQHSTLPIPQICVNNNDDDDDDDNGHITILNEFDQVLENESKRISVIRTLSLKQNDSTDHIGAPLSQQRSFSFSLGSKPNIATVTEKHDDNDTDDNNNDDDDDNDSDEHANPLPLKTMKLPATSKSGLRPSIFGVFASKLNTTTTTTTTTDNTSYRCSVCKKLFIKSHLTTNDDNQQLSLSKTLRDQKQLQLHIKRRQSLPSLFHHLLEPSSPPILNSNVNDNINHEQHQQTSLIISHSFCSLRESDDNHDNNSLKRQRSNYHDSSQQTEKGGTNDENDNEFTSHIDESTTINNNEITIENNTTNQQFLHPPEEKTRSLLTNVFRTRRSNLTLDSPETNMSGKQFSVSVLNLTTSINTSRRNSAIATINESTFDPRKHALSEENLPSMDNTYIYFNDINGQSFKEKLKYSTTSENTTLREMLIKLFEKHHLSIEKYYICLRSAPTLQLSLDQPVKHLLLNDLVVTESINPALAKTSAGKERKEKRNSTGSAVLPSNSKTTSKRLSTHCMMLDNDDNSDAKSSTRMNKTNRSSIFTGSIFTRDTSDSTERSESNLSFVRRKCEEWLIHGLPKLAQLQCSTDECDLVIEKEWQPYLTEQARTLMSETTKLQQEAIYELLTTEVSYIRQILTMTDILMTSVSILKSSQREGIFNDIDMEKLFSNIQEVLHGNLLFWKEILLPIKVKLKQHGLPMNPSDLKNGFLNFDVYFKPYLHYVLDQKTSAEYFKQKLSRDELFQSLISWIESNYTNRLSFSDLTIKPLQRLTRYKLLLEAIQKKTNDTQQRHDLHEMIQKVATFVNRVNSKLHNQEQEERIRQINDRIGPYEYVSAPPELSSILQEYNRDSLSNRLDLLQDMPLHVRGYRRQIIQQGPMKMKDAKNSQDVYCYLFSDMFLITKGGKRSGSTNSPLISTHSDGSSNRPSSNIVNKILKPPIRIDRIDVREYDRRGGNSNNTEPNTASFVALIFSEYNLIENGYLFQTNLSKQWIENIRTTKTNFQLIMEESKLKFQTLHSTTSSSVSTNTIQECLSTSPSPSIDLSIPSVESANLATDDISRRSSKVESDVFKIVEQTRRNSRTDRKNFGRYFTADGTSTHETNSSATPTKQISSSSITIVKRMSWNNEQSSDKADSSLITNSFRSVHSSSGVSSTGSFLFSTDEDSSVITTTTSSSIPSIVPSIKNEEFDTKSSVSTVVGVDDQTRQHSSYQGRDDSTKNDVEMKNNPQLTTQLSSSSTNTSTLTLTNQTITESSSSMIGRTTSPESSLRRTPFASVKKRTQPHRPPYQQQQQGHRRHRIFDENDTNSSIHINVYDSPRSINDQTIRSSDDSPSLITSGNESDYDNNRSTTVRLPVIKYIYSDELIHTDDLLLGDQNEITLHNDTHIENHNNQQSDTIKISSSSSLSSSTSSMKTNIPSLDDSAPHPNLLAYRKDSLTSRRLIDIRSHLLLNTTLDATEV
ncbi:hypothetical protein I4U23_014285 [Adineta vaga]|nr:hypothetical protein I4U23_014285 [Adineta vaga]